MGVKIKRLGDLRLKLVLLGKAVRKRLSQEGKDMKKIARDLSPVRTGKFRKGWRARSSSRRLLLTNAVPYADYVHRKGEPTPLIREQVAAAAEERKPKLVADLQEIATKIMNGD